MAYIKMSTTITPFLYQTRTLYHFARAGYPLPTTLARSIHTTPPRRVGARNSIPFELPPGLERENPDPQEPDEDYVPNPKGTITSQERETFKNIFREIAERGQGPSAAKPSNHPDLPSADDRYADGGKARRSADARHAVNLVMEDAARTFKDTQPVSRGLDPLSPLETTYSAADRETELLRFPPSLRRAARWAFGAIDTGKDAELVRTEGGGQEELGQYDGDGDAVETIMSPEGDRLGRLVELQAFRREETLRIQDIMKTAKSDFELWDVMEKEVFQLVERLGISENKKPKKKTTTKGRRAIVVNEEDDPSKKPLSMEIYGAIYPQLLLDSINYFDTKFSRPSTLCFSVLPRVKALGLTSYVLGVSTSFYNRLMAITWHRYGDAGAVMSLLEEMRHAGLYLDENTQSVVHNIEREFLAAMHGQHGMFAEKLMGMPEFEPVAEMRIKHWLGNIDRSIKERKQGLEY